MNPEAIANFAETMRGPVIGPTIRNTPSRENSTTR